MSIEPVWPPTTPEEYRLLRADLDEFLCRDLSPRLKMDADQTRALALEVLADISSGARVCGPAISIVMRIKMDEYLHEETARRDLGYDDLEALRAETLRLMMIVAADLILNETVGV